MQNQTLETLVRLILEMIREEERKFLFLITASHQEETILLEELRRLLERYPESKVCMDPASRDCYPRILQENHASDRLIRSAKDVEQEVRLADTVAILSLDLSTLRKVSMGLDDNMVTHACMEALLHGKPVIAADEEYRGQLAFARESYRKIFEEAKVRLESYGVTFCPLHEILTGGNTAGGSAAAGSRPAPALPAAKPEARRSGARQLVTVEALARDKDLVIEEDAIITPAAKELLKNRR